MFVPCYVLSRGPMGEVITDPFFFIFPIGEVITYLFFFIFPIGDVFAVHDEMTHPRIGG